MWCTPGSLTISFFQLRFIEKYPKTCEVKKIHWTIRDFQYNFHSNIVRHHREITIVKFRIKIGTCQVTDCRPQSFLYILFIVTLLCDAHCGAWLRVGMHTAEFDSGVWCTPRSLTPGYDAHRGVRLCGMMHTVEHYSMVRCTQWSMIPQYNTQCRAF